MSRLIQSISSNSFPGCWTWNLTLCQGWLVRTRPQKWGKMAGAQSREEEAPQGRRLPLQKTTSSLVWLSTVARLMQGTTTPSSRTGGNGQEGSWGRFQSCLKASCSGKVHGAIQSSSGTTLHFLSTYHEAMTQWYGTSQNKMLINSYVPWIAVWGLPVTLTCRWRASHSFNQGYFLKCSFDISWTKLSFYCQNKCEFRLVTSRLFRVVCFFTETIN